MKIAPAYDGTSPLVMDVDVAAVGDAVARQRRRFGAMLDALADEQWTHPTRCSEWMVRDVVAHLVGVDRFWAASVRAGVAGTPTRFLEHFDPAAVPKQMVAAMQSLTVDELRAQHAGACSDLLDAFASLAADEWDASAESPAGHVPVWSLAHHALWDCWIHERDIALPLGLAVPVDADEVIACLRYCATIGPVLTLSSAETPDARGVYGISADEPRAEFRIDIGEQVRITDAPAPSGSPCLRGAAADLVEALSIRAPLPADAPPEWRTLAASLAAVFDTDLAG